MDNLTRINALIGEVESLSITCDAELENANRLAKEFKKEIKAIKDEYKDGIAQYHKLHKEAKAKEKQALEPINKAYDVLSKAIGIYMRDREKRMLELRKAEEELFGEAMPEKKLDLGGTHVKKTWKARVIDPDKVPDKWGNHRLKIVDEAKLNEIARFEKGNAQIEGVEFYLEETTIIRNG